MAWEARGRTGRRYFYKSIRTPQGVRKVYIGAGRAAHEAAKQIEAARVRRAADERELAGLQARLAAADQLGVDVQQGVDLLAEATLLSLGFREHRGEWRLRRG